MTGRYVVLALKETKNRSLSAIQRLYRGRVVSSVYIHDAAVFRATNNQSFRVGVVLVKCTF